MDQETTETKHGPLALGLAACVLVYLARAWPSLNTLVDDAWISARYAQQAAAGNGLVYNAGEPPIEGFTNLLWTLWLIPAHLLELPIERVMEGSGLFFGALAIVFTGLAVRSLQTRPSITLPLAASLTLALSIHHAVSSTNGLETSMFTAACVMSLWVCTRTPNSLLAGMSLALLPLIRPEGLALSLLIAAALSTSRRRFLTAALPVFTSIAGLTAWRWFTYGALLPNTLAAKSNGAWYRNLSTNLNYLGADGPLWIGPLLALLLVVATLKSAGHLRLRSATLVAILAMLLAAMRVDLWMPGARLLVPGTALLLVLAFSAGRPKVALAWLALSFVMPFTPSERRNRRYDRVHSIALPNGTQRAMNHILEHLPKDTWISTRDAGLVAYLVGPDRKVAETHGRALTQLHPGGKKARVLRYTPVNPDVIVLTQADGGVRGIRYPPDERLVKRLTSTYTYLGRVRQHFRRHYDLYVRADHPMPPLPEKWVINRRGPDLKPRAARSSAPRPGKARK